MKTSFLLLVLSLCLHAGFAQPGSLDPSFGKEGIVRTTVGAPVLSNKNGIEVLAHTDGSLYFVDQVATICTISKRRADGSLDSAYGHNGVSDPVAFAGVHAVLQANCKIVVASAGTLARFNMNGTLDSSFGVGGLAAMPIGDEDAVTSIVIASDGKIIVAGHTFSSSDGFRALFIIKFNNDGTSDESFNPFRVQDMIANDLTVQPDGKILLGGSGLFRLNSDGTRDSSFNGTGQRPMDGSIMQVRFNNHGKIVAAIHYDGPGGSATQLAQLNADGSIDSSFANNGFQQAAFVTQLDYTNSMLIQPDDRIVIGGSELINARLSFVIKRITAAGFPDSSFSGDGMSVTSFNGETEMVNSLALLPAGGLVGLGYSMKGVTYYEAAARYKADGSPDNSFGVNGKQLDSNAASRTFFTASAVQADGKLVNAGYAWNGGDYDFAVVRYNTNGNLDTGFSQDGKLLLALSSINDIAHAIAIQADGKILVAGSAGNNFGLIRLNPDGTPDGSFGVAGKLPTDPGVPGSINSIVVQPDGKIVVGGSQLVRYNADGSQDAAFTPVATFSAAIALQTDGKIISAGGVSDITSVSRYNTDGSLDAFGEDGRFQSYSTVAHAVAVQKDGKIVIGGAELVGDGRDAGFASLVTRLNADGTVDGTFGAGGMVTINDGSILTSLQIDSNATIYAGGANTGVPHFRLYAFNINGALDTGFAGGSVVTAASPGGDHITALALSPGKLYAVGEGMFAGVEGVTARYLVDGNGASNFVSRGDGNWNDPATWAGGIVPPATAAVIVQHHVAVTADATCASLKIATPAGYVVVNSGVHFIITQ